MNLNKLTSLLLCLLMAAMPLCLAEETDAEKIARLEAELQQKNQYIAQLEAQLEALFMDGYSDEDAAAEFDGGFISIADARAEYEYRAYYYEMFSMDPAEYAEELKMEILETLAEDAILEQKARALGVYEPDESTRAAMEQQAQAQLDEMVAYYKQYRYQDGMTEEEVTQSTLDYLAQEGYSLESMYEALAAQSWRNRLYDITTKDINITEDELKAFYTSMLAEQQALFTTSTADYEYSQADGLPIVWNPEGVKAFQYVLIGFSQQDMATYTQLLAKLEENGTEEDMQQLEKLYVKLETVADEVYGRALAGDDFLLLIDEYSADSTFDTEPWRAQGLYMTPNSIYPNYYIDALSALEKPGDISAPIRCDEGIIIFLYAADVEAGAIPFEDVRARIEPSALQEKKDIFYEQTVEQWKAEANLRYYPERL